MEKLILLGIFVILFYKLGGLMATFNDVKAVLESVKAGVDALELAIADLKKMVADGHVITQAELDELHSMAAGVMADIADPSDQEHPAPPVE